MWLTLPFASLSYSDASGHHNAPEDHGLQGRNVYFASDVLRSTTSDKQCTGVIDMQGRIFPLTCILVMLILAAACGSALAIEYGTVEITNINAPSSVRSGQPVTISVTISYDLMQALLGENLFVALLPQAANSAPYPITSVSNNCEAIGNASLCIAQTGQEQTLTSSVITVSFTLTSPRTTETWQPGAYAIITISNQDGSGYTPEVSVNQTITIAVT